MAEQIVITIREDGSRVVVRNIREIGTTSKSSQADVNGLKNALLGLGGALAINELTKWMDIWTQATGKVNIFTHSIGETNAVMEQLFQVAQRTRQPIEGIVSSFHQLSIAGSALGASQAQLIDFTENIGMALAVQGTSAQTAAGGIIQLGQAMNEGIVRAQEYNSMINSMPIVLKAVANNLEGVDGSLAKLRKRMLEGKLYSKDFFEALLKGGPQIREMFDRSGKTIAQSFTIMRNAAIRYVGDIDQAYQISQRFFALATWGAANIDVLAKSLTALAAPLILNRLIALANVIRAIGVAALANPFVALAAAVVAAITALTLFRHEIILIQEDSVSLGDYMNATWDYILQGGRAVYDFFKDDLSNAFSLVSADIQASVPMIIAAFDSIVLNLNNMIGVFVGIGKAIGIALASGTEPFKSAFVDAINWILGKAEDLVNTVIDTINSKLPDAKVIDLVSFPQLENKYADDASQLGDAIQNAFAESMSVDYVGALFDKGSEMLDALTAKATEYAKARQAADKAANPDMDLTGLLGEGEDFAGSAKGKVNKAMDRLRKDLIALMNQVAPAEGAVLALSKAQDTLARSVAAGFITQEQSNRYWALAKTHYEEIIKPLTRYNKDLDEQFALLGKTTGAREIEATMLKARRELMEKGAEVDEAELARLRTRLKLYQDLNKVQQAQDALLQDSVDRRDDMVIQLEAINKLLADPNSGFTGADANDALTDMYPELFQGTQAYVQKVVDHYSEMFAQIKQLRAYDLIDEQTANQMRLQALEGLKQAIIAAEIEASNARLALGSGDWADALISSFGKVQEGFTTLMAGTADAMGSMFTTLTDGFADAAANSIMNATDLGDALKDVARNAITQLISSLIKLGIQWAIQSALAMALGASTTVASAGMAAATATAWAPAAAMVSLATFGTNSAGAMAGITATNSLSMGMALAGFKDGGFTGNMGVNEVAGVVHGQEFVNTASATARYRPYLEAMNDGTFSPNMGANQKEQRAGAPRISITNNGTPQEYQVQGYTEDEIRLIATDVADKRVKAGAGKAVAKDLRNPNSAASKSFGTNTMTKRRR